MFTTDALQGHTYLIAGVANDMSLATSIARAIHAAGGNIIILAHPANKKRAGKIADDLNAPLLTCDVSDAEQLQYVGRELAEYAPFYGFVHAIAFSNKDELRGRFLDTTRENFLNTMQISCFSFVELARMIAPNMTDGGSMLTLTFDASRGTYPHYNVMALAKAALETATLYLAADLGAQDIRVNALAASPEMTLSARGIGDFRLIGQFAEAMSPMGRRATPEEIANMALFLLSPMGAGTTGQTVFVDCGSSSSTMCPARNAEHMREAMAAIAETHGRKGGDK